MILDVDAEAFMPVLIFSHSIFATLFYAEKTKNTQQCMCVGFSIMCESRIANGVSISRSGAEIYA